MANKAVFLRVGLLLVAGVAAAVGLVFMLQRNKVSGGVPYETYFSESVQGLDVGAAVKYRGVALGQVTEIGLVSAAYSRNEQSDLRPAAARLVFVRFVIDPTRVGRTPSETDAIRLGLRARLASAGITGLAYLELDFVNPQKFPIQEVPWHPRYPYIPSVPSTISQVQDAAQTLLAKIQGVDFQKIAVTLQTVLDDLHIQLSDGGDAQAAMKSAAALLNTLDTGVQQADLPGLAADLKATSAAMRTLANGKDTTALLASTTKAADRLGAAADRLPALIAAMQTTLRHADTGTSDLLGELAPLLRDARAAVANLRDTSETLRRYPASVLMGGAPPKEPTR